MGGRNVRFFVFDHLAASVVLVNQVEEFICVEIAKVEEHEIPTSGEAGKLALFLILFHNLTRELAQRIYAERVILGTGSLQ